MQVIVSACDIRLHSAIATKDLPTSNTNKRGNVIINSNAIAEAAGEGGGPQAQNICRDGVGEALPGHGPVQGQTYGG
jgi:hypothetical protein